MVIAINPITTRYEVYLKSQLLSIKIRCVNINVPVRINHIMGASHMVFFSLKRSRAMVKIIKAEINATKFTMMWENSSGIKIE